MKRYLRARILLLTVLVFTFFQVHQAAAWYCEGKRCGVTPWRCCCQDHEGESGNCDRPQQAQAPVHAGQALQNCTEDCGCSLVSITTSEEASITPAAALPAESAVALLEEPITLYVAPILVEIRVEHVEARGPPPDSSSVLTLSLRAPPVA